MVNETRSQPIERDASASWKQPAKTQFEAKAQKAQRRYEDSRRLHRILYPIIPREVIEANMAEPKLMTPEEIIAAGAKLIIKG